MQRKTALSALTLFAAAVAGELHAMPRGFDDARELLIVERAKDARQRDSVLRRIWNTRLRLQAKKASARELLVSFNIAAHKKVGFALWPRADEDFEPITLELKRAKLLDAMSIIQRTTPYRWVYGHGVIWLKHESQVKEETYVRIYDVRQAITRIRSFPGPRMGLGLNPDFEMREPEESEATLSGLDIDRIQELIQRHVDPESWDKENVSLDAGRGVLIIRQTLRGHRQLRRFLRRIGVI